MNDICEHCGAKIVRYWHRLNKPLVSAMIKIYLKAGLNPVKISEFLGHNQVCNFQKLKYWEFVRKAQDSDGEEGKGGMWKLTSRAEQFIKGYLQVPQKVQTYRGSPTDCSTEFIGVGDVVEGYQYKPDYVRDAE